MRFIRHFNTLLPLRAQTLVAFVAVIPVCAEARGGYTRDGGKGLSFLLGFGLLMLAFWVGKHDPALLFKVVGCGIALVIVFAWLK